VPRNSIHHLLDQLDELKTRFSARESRSVEKVLTRIARQKVSDVETLIRLHEILLFLSAYPPSARVRALSESILKDFAKRVDGLRETDADLTTLETPEVSGIAGTSVTDTFSYYIVRWLLNRHARQIKFDWDWFDDESRLAETWPRFMPLLEEDAFVEANVPYTNWLRAASRGRRRELSWLLQQFERLQLADKEKAELYNSQKLYVAWTFSFRESRTGMRLPVRNIFYHREPLIQRRDVSLKDELEKPSPALKRHSPQAGAAILDMTRVASSVRYRELYGFTHGDARKVFQTNLGRGIDVFIVGVPPGPRLPLRAYHAAMIFKNGVPVGYFEGISLFERMESGFNLYYTFREGETAWLYARILNIFRHLLGVTAFSLDPYQIGFENEEGIESGAFWFYRKLGFRPTNPDVMKLVLNEEEKLATRTNYRTTPHTLRKLAEGSMIFELEKPLRSAPGESRSGDWDRFQVRKIGLAVQRHMAAKFAGDAEKFRAAAVKELVRVLGVKTNDWREAGLSAFSDFAVTLSLVDDLSRWNKVEKEALVKIIRAKATSDESAYLKLMQKHVRLRAAMIRLGS
jgi:hypothetical protein